MMRLKLRATFCLVPQSLQPNSLSEEAIHMRLIDLVEDEAKAVLAQDAVIETAALLRI